MTNSAGKSAGQPFILRDWQKAIIRGIYDRETDGLRDVRTALLTMPRKNGKTELIAALSLVHLCGPESEANGQVYSAAADREQAALVFNVAVSMVRACPHLNSILNVIESQKRIVHYSTGSFYKALSSESKTKHGINASCVIYDELAQAPNRELWDVLTTSVAAREEPLVLAISTASSDPNSIMSEMVEYGRKVLSGIHDDPSFYACIYEAAKDDDVWDEAVWHKANPALGDFRSLDEMRQFATRAKRLPSAEATFRNLYLNQPVDSASQLLSSADWLGCGQEFDLADFEGADCYGGLDLSERQDLTALVLVFPRDGKLYTASWFWLPDDGLVEKSEKDKVPYTVWRDQGHLETTPGRVIRYAYVVRRLQEIVSRFNLKQLKYDRWHIEKLRQEAADVGLELPLENHGQGFKDMSPAVDRLEAAILSGDLIHNNNPVLTWCAANAKAEQDAAGNRKFAKQKSYGRIDGVVALSMALTAVGNETSVNPVSPWEDPDYRYEF